MKRNQAVKFAANYSEQEVQAALAAAAEACRFAESNLASILRHRRRNGGDQVVVPLVEGRSLQHGTSRWDEVSR